MDRSIHPPSVLDDLTPGHAISLGPLREQKGTSMWLRSSCLDIGRTQRETVHLCRAIEMPLRKEKGGVQRPEAEETHEGSIGSIYCSKRLGSACQDATDSHGVLGHRTVDGPEDKSKNAAHTGPPFNAGPSPKQRPKMAPLP